jgi:Skp family chaperone for outer membrane proteins
MLDRIFDIGSILSFLGILITIWFSRKELAAKVSNINANTRKTEVEIGGQYQAQIDHLIIKNAELFEKMEDMRISYENKMDSLEKMLEEERRESEKTIKRMSLDIYNLQNDLRIERERSLSLVKQIERQGERMSEVKKDVKRITGELPMPAEPTHKLP